MNKFAYLLLFLCSLHCHLALCQKDFNAQPILDSTIAIAKRISLYSDEVKWDSLGQEMTDLGRNAKDIQDLAPCFEMMLNELRDHHGMIRKTEDYSLVASFTDYENIRFHDNRQRDPEIWEVVNDPNSRFQYRLLEGGVGYLKVVGVGPQIDGQNEAERIRNAIYELQENGANSWIIDLRFNGGGNVNVMLSGLAPLLTDGEIASIRGKDGARHGNVEIKNGDFYYYDVNAFPIGATPKIEAPKVAVLTSRWTVSSGELVAVAFKGQASAKFFGESTGGYTTNNSWDYINDELVMAISTGLYCDRDGIVYTHFVSVDEELHFNPYADAANDRAVQRAMDWLTE